MADQEFAGFLYNNAGTAISGATVHLYSRNDTATSVANTTTNSSGYWTISHGTQGQFDVEITSGTSVRRIKYDTSVQYTALEVADFRIRNPGNTYKYDIVPAAISADRQLNLPAITGPDTLAVLGLAQTFSANQTFTGTITVGVDDTGKDVKFFGATSGQYLLWDESADELVLTGDTKLSFHDAAGGENIIASADGHLEVNAGTTLDITAPTVDLNSSTEFNIDTAIYDLNATGAVTIDAAGLTTITGTNNAVGAIYLRANGGTSETLKIHSDQGTSVTEGAESVTILSDAGGVGIRSTANLANAINLTVDGGTTSSMTLFNDQGTGATEGSASIQLLSDVGGINLKSGLNAANAILLTADGGTSETIVLHADQGSGADSIKLLSDAGGITLEASSVILGDLVFINDTANGSMTYGLTITHSGSESNEYLTLKGTDVAHGITGQTETDTVMRVKRVGGADGGVTFDGFGKSSYAIRLRGMATADNTAKSTSASAPIELFGYKKEGSDIGDPGTNANLVTIRKGGDVRFIFDAEGSAHADVEWVAYDSYDDVALMKDFQAILTDSKCEARYQLEAMEDAGIVGQDSLHWEGDKLRAMVNFSRLAMIHHGAIGQVSDRLQAYEIELQALRQANDELRTLMAGRD